MYTAVYSVKVSYRISVGLLLTSSFYSMFCFFFDVTSSHMTSKYSPFIASIEILNASVCTRHEHKSAGRNCIVPRRFGFGNFLHKFIGSFAISGT